MEPQEVIGNYCHPCTLRRRFLDERLKQAPKIPSSSTGFVTESSWKAYDKAWQNAALVSPSRAEDRHTQEGKS